ncbi:YfcE family phosphodiesterase [Singulisphaera sp. PoT]|uniref:YfcE family phosphodiesterase n=1 Tax=Singulisphaera sp. PoT TaxID=3411797 RepID=UPI003BF4CDF1
MRIGILSDTHDKVGRTSRAVALLLSEGAEVLIHCGDLTEPDVVYECIGAPAYFVFGNNDFDVKGLRKAMQVIDATCLEWGGEVELAGKRIAVTHGDSMKEIRRLLAKHPDYLLTGHTHAPSDEREGNTRLINPGALHRTKVRTMAILDVATDELRFLTLPEKE